MQKSGQSEWNGKPNKKIQKATVKNQTKTKGTQLASILFGYDFKEKNINLGMSWSFPPWQRSRGGLHLHLLLLLHASISQRLALPALPAICLQQGHGAWPGPGLTVVSQIKNQALSVFITRELDNWSGFEELATWTRQKSRATNFVATVVTCTHVQYHYLVSRTATPWPGPSSGCCWTAFFGSWCGSTSIRCTAEAAVRSCQMLPVEVIPHQGVPQKPWFPCDPGYWKGDRSAVFCMHFASNSNIFVLCLTCNRVGCLTALSGAWLWGHCWVSSIKKRQHNIHNTR